MKRVQKDFILGDKWFYIKLYTGVKTADTVLLEIIQPLTEQLISEKLIDKWFFIRYSDPDFHLRIRFHMQNVSSLGVIISRLNVIVKPYLESQLVSSMQIDAYSRELNRYGSSIIEEVESLFCCDSNKTLVMLNLIEGDEGENYRWHYACIAVDVLLSDFELSELEKFELMQRLQHGFGQEFGMNNQLKVQLDKKFRNERQNMRSFMLKENDFYRPFYQIIEQKSNDTSLNIKKIKRLYQNNELELDNFLGSFIHMLLNRIFKSKQRLNEMVIYSLLYRFYRSEIARKRKAL